MELTPAPDGSSQDRDHWFQVVFDSTSDLMAMHRVEHDERFVFAHINRSLRAFHAAARPGIDPGAWIGRGLAEVMQNDLGLDSRRREDILVPYHEAVLTGRVIQVSHVAGIGPDARHREGVITPLKDAQGRVTHLFYRGTDITDRLRAEAELRHSAERFEAVFKLSPVPIVIGSVDDGRYFTANDAWLRLHGYTREEIEGQTSISLGVADAQDRRRVVEGLSRDGEVRGLKARFRKKSGEYFDSLFAATFIEWKGERALVGIPYDVSELEERVVQRTLALEEANRELEAFSYSVSHDLRTPLRAISGFTELLSERPGLAGDAEGKDYARRVNAAATRMGKIVDALLKFSRLSRQGIAMRDVDLAAAVEAIIAEYAQATARRKLSWHVGYLPVVQGDPTLLRLVLQNLLDNAVKYTARRDDPVIEVDASQVAGETVVRVKDNGIGFDMKYAAKVFGVFERLHADGEFEGTGIGLANAQRIVHRHGGRIWCESAPDEGACFHFSLPSGRSSKV